tara:strand:- start:625 stop:1308 length:684 start_codon:yes stop_codon:yes gene_type:complete
MIRQPGYMPNIGFFKKIQSCEKFVFLDDSQFAKDKFDNRNKIRTLDGYRWITVPLQRPVFGKNLNEIDISNEYDWRKEHKDLIFESYNKTDYFSSYWNSLKNILDKNFSKLIDLNLELIHFFMTELKISTETILSSDLKIFENKTQKLVSICSKLNATCYISGISGHDYLDENLFGEQKIKLIYENFIHPKYNQIHGDFIENMSIIDLVMNQGDTSMKILLDSKNIP